MARDVTSRFSNRVGDYVKHRPGYPTAVVELLRRECGLNSETIAADFGSGPGIFTRLLLEAGATVFAVEPNEPMRAAAERQLAGFPGFRSVAASAESTGLPDRSCDLVTAAQAWHWFEPVTTAREVRRILRPAGHAALIWNGRRAGGSAFLEAYEDLLRRRAPEYGKSGHRTQSDESIDALFGAGRWRRFDFEQFQSFDRAGLRGRLMSSSYAPAAGQPGHREMLEELDAIFDAHQQAGRVEIPYDVRVFLGRPGAR